MIFINEKVSEFDIKKYGLRAINQKYMKADIDYRWTVDKEQDIYLRWLGADHELLGRNDFSFYWKGVLLNIELTYTCEGKRGGSGSTTWAIYPNDGTGIVRLPQNLESKREKIILDLKDALIAYKDFGIGSTIVDHTAYFEF